MIEHMTITMHGVDALGTVFAFVALILISVSNALLAQSKRRFERAAIWAFSAIGWSIALYIAGAQLI